MARDIERIERLQEALRKADAGALVCTLPANVLLLSGYWPVIGSSIAIFTRQGETILVVPEDEKDLAANGWANRIETFEAASPQQIEKTTDAVRPVLTKLAKELGLERARIGCEIGGSFEPSSYAGMFFYGAAGPQLIEEALQGAHVLPADDLVRRQRAVKTALEIERIRTACRVAHQAFIEGADSLRAGLLETEVAALFGVPLGIQDVDVVDRAGGFTFCMSGPNGALAYRAYQRSTTRRLQRHDLALVHCNSYVDGFWTDITRTYCIETPNEHQQQMYQAVLDARAAALHAIKPGVKASDVDQAAREVLERRGFGKEFKNPTGHGAGFAAVDHGAAPRLYTTGEQSLEPGMVFNVEPAIYIEGLGGLRHCDMVVVTGDGAEVLTEFHTTVEELTIS